MNNLSAITNAPTLVQAIARQVSAIATLIGKVAFTAISYFVATLQAVPPLLPLTIAIAAGITIGFIVWNRLNGDSSVSSRSNVEPTASPQSIQSNVDSTESLQSTQSNKASGSRTRNNSHNLGTKKRKAQIPLDSSYTPTRIVKAVSRQAGFEPNSAHISFNSIYAEARDRTFIQDETNDLIGVSPYKSPTDNKMPALLTATRDTSDVPVSNNDVITAARHVSDSAIVTPKKVWGVKRTLRTIIPFAFSSKTNSGGKLSRSNSEDSMPSKSTNETSKTEKKGLFTFPSFRSITSKPKENATIPVDSEQKAPAAAQLHSNKASAENLEVLAPNTLDENKKAKEQLDNIISGEWLFGKNDPNDQPVTVVTTPEETESISHSSEEVPV